VEGHLGDPDTKLHRLSPLTHEAVPGADASLPYVLTPEQLMLEGKEAPGDRVVVYDCEGYFMGVNLAVRLAREGKHVTYLTPNAHPGAYMHFTGEAVRLHALLHELHVELVTQRLLDRVAPGEATTMNAAPAGNGRSLASTEASAWGPPRRSRTAS
jgi:dimethylamine/trimethylamine dehydrogenase